MSSWEIENYPRYFVKDYHTVAGRPKLEDAVMNYAKEQFLYCIIYQQDFKDLVSHLKAFHDKLRETNKRLMPVTIELDNKDFHAGLRWLRIGQQYIVLQRVKDEIQTIDPLFSYTTQVTL